MIAINLAVVLLPVCVYYYAVVERSESYRRERSFRALGELQGFLATRFDILTALLGQGGTLTNTAVPGLESFGRSRLAGILAPLTKEAVPGDEAKAARRERGSVECPSQPDFALYQEAGRHRIVAWVAEAPHECKPRAVSVALEDLFEEAVAAREFDVVLLATQRGSVLLRLEHRGGRESDWIRKPGGATGVEPDVPALLRRAKLTSDPKSPAAAGAAASSGAAKPSPDAKSPSPDSGDAAVHGSAAFIERLAGRQYEVYVHPISLRQAIRLQDDEKDDAGATAESSFVVIGLRRARGVAAASSSLGPGAWWFATVAILLLIAAWPFLRLAFWESHDSLARGQLLLLGIGTGVVAMLLTLLLWSAAHHLRLRQHLTEACRVYSEKVAARVKEDIAKAKESLIVARRWYQTPAPANGSSTPRDVGAAGELSLRGLYFPIVGAERVDERKSEEWRRIRLPERGKETRAQVMLPATMILPAGGQVAEALYPDFFRILALDVCGRPVGPSVDAFQEDEVRFRAITLRSREYFSRLKNRATPVAAKSGAESESPLSAQRLYNKIDGSRRLQVAILAQEPEEGDRARTPLSAKVHCLAFDGQSLAFRETRKLCSCDDVIEAETSARATLKKTPDEAWDAVIGNGRPFVVTLDMANYGLSSPVPLGPLRFVVFDLESGGVRFQSDDRRSLVENFYSESDQSVEVRAAADAGVPSPVLFRYRGENARGYFQAIPERGWGVIAYYEDSSTGSITLASGLVSLAILLVLMGGLALLLLLGHALVGRRLSWLWPQWRLRQAYPAATLLLALQGGVVHFALSSAGSWRFYLALVLSTGVIATGGYALLAAHGIERDPIRRAAGLFALTSMLLLVALGARQAIASGWLRASLCLLLGLALILCAREGWRCLRIGDGAGRRANPWRTASPLTVESLVRGLRTSAAGSGVASRPGASIEERPARRVGIRLSSGRYTREYVIFMTMVVVVAIALPASRVYERSLALMLEASWLRWDQEASEALRSRVGLMAAESARLREGLVTPYAPADRAAVWVGGPGWTVSATSERTEASRLVLDSGFEMLRPPAERELPWPDPLASGAWRRLGGFWRLRGAEWRIFCQRIRGCSEVSALEAKAGDPGRSGEPVRDKDLESPAGSASPSSPPTIELWRQPGKVRGAGYQTLALRPGVPERLAQWPVALGVAALTALLGLMVLFLARRLLWVSSPWPRPFGTKRGSVPTLKALVEVLRSVQVRELSRLMLVDRRIVAGARGESEVDPLSLLASATGSRTFDLLDLRDGFGSSARLPEAGVLVLRNLDLSVLESGRRKEVLNLLERALAVEDLRVVLLADVSPLYLLTRPDAYPDDVIPDEPSEAEQARWVRALEMLQKVYLLPTDSGRPDKVPNLGLADFVDRECRALWPKLSEVRDDLYRMMERFEVLRGSLQRGVAASLEGEEEVRGEAADRSLRSSSAAWRLSDLSRAVTTAVRRLRHGGQPAGHARALRLEYLASEVDRAVLSQRDVEDYLSAHSDSFFRRAWLFCTRDERLTLFHLANRRLVNPRDDVTVEHLMRRGLVVFEPEPRIVSRSFAEFVRSAEKPARMAEWASTAQQGTWQSVRVPFFLVLMLLVAWGAYSAGESFQVIAAILAGTLGVVANIVRAIGLIRGSGQETRT